MQEVEVTWADAARGSVPGRVAARRGEVGAAQAGPVFVKIRLPPLRGAQALPQPYAAACECSDRPRKKAKVRDPRAALREGLDSLPPLGDPLVASLRAQLDDVPPSAPPPAVPGYSLPDRLSARLAIDWPRPAEREAIRRCLYYLRWKNAQQQAGHRSPAEAPAQPPGMRTRLRSQGGAKTRRPPARFELETTIYKRLHAGAPPECRRCRCRQRFREGLARDLAAWLRLLATPTELTQLLIAGEPLYELYRLAREEGSAQPDELERKHWSTVCEQVLRLCRPGLGPFTSAAPGTDGYQALQRLFTGGLWREECSTARVWIYCLGLELHRAGGLGGLPDDLPRPDDLACANLPPAPPPAADFSPWPLPCNFWPQILLDRVDRRAWEPPALADPREPLVVLEHDLAIACASSFKGEYLSDAGYRQAEWPPALSDIARAVDVQVARLEFTVTEPGVHAGPHHLVFFHGSGLWNPHIRRSLPPFPVLTDDRSKVRELEPREEPDLGLYTSHLCFDKAMYDLYSVKPWRLGPLRLVRLHDGRLGYAGTLPLDLAAREEVAEGFLCVLEAWLRPFRRTADSLSLWLPNPRRGRKPPRVVLDRRPPYQQKHQQPERQGPERRGGAPPAGAGYAELEPQRRLDWQQLGWDRELRWSSDQARDRRVLTLRSLLVGALGVLDARLNPVVSMERGTALLYSGQPDVGGYPRTGLRPLGAALSLLRELYPSWECPGKLCPVEIELDPPKPPRFWYGGHSSDEPQVRETDFTVYVCSALEHAFLLCKQRAGTAVELTLWDSNGSESASYDDLQSLCQSLELQNAGGQHLARLLGLAEAGETEALLGCYLYPRAAPTLQEEEGSCTSHALLLAAVAVVDGPACLPREQGARGLSDAWLLLGTALGLRWCLLPAARARLLFLPPGQEDDFGRCHLEGFGEQSVLQAQ